MAVWTVAAGVGPFLGGVFAQHSTWRWCFWINLPITGLAFVLLALFLNVHSPKTKFREGVQAMDWGGTLLLLAFVVMLLLGLQLGGDTVPWKSSTVICLITFGAITLLLLLMFERKFASDPILPLGLFTGRSNLSLLVIGFIDSFVCIPFSRYVV